MCPRALCTSVWTLAILRPPADALAHLAPVVADALVAKLAERALGARDVAVVAWSTRRSAPTRSRRVRHFAPRSSTR